MKLTVLGGSAAGPNTGQGCSGYLVEVGDTRLVLDLGPGTLTELRRHADFRTLDAVVISHWHADHVLDLVALRFALAYNPDGPPGRIPLWLPPGGRAALDRAASAYGDAGKEDRFWSEQFEVAEFDAARELGIGAARLSFGPTIHYVPCWAIRVAGATPGALFYSADLGPSSDIAALAQGAIVVVVEGTASEGSPEPFEERGHLTPAEAAHVAKAAGAETMVLTHLWEERGIGQAVEAAAAVFPGRLEAARPGLSVEW